MGLLGHTNSKSKSTNFNMAFRSRYKSYRDENLRASLSQQPALIERVVVRPAHVHHGFLGEFGLGVP